MPQKAVIAKKLIFQLLYFYRKQKYNLGLCRLLGKCSEDIYYKTKY